MNKHVNKKKQPKLSADYGETPVILTSAAVPKKELKRAQLNVEPGQTVVLEPQLQARKLGMRERILSAQSPGEIETLNQESQSFAQASEKTRRRWHAAADRRLNDLQSHERKAAA